MSGERRIPKPIAVLMVGSIFILEILEFIAGFFVVGEIATPLVAPAVDLAEIILSRIYGVSLTKNSKLFLFTFFNWCVKELPFIGEIWPGDTISMIQIIWQNKKNMDAEEAAELNAQQAVQNATVNAANINTGIVAQQALRTGGASNVREMPRRQAPAYSPRTNARMPLQRNDVRPIHSGHDSPNTLDLKQAA
jgi:hypothetical protein